MGFSSITGMGTVTPAGIGVDSFWNQALQGRSYIQSGLGQISETITSTLAEKTSQKLNRPLLIAYHSILEAMEQAGWSRFNTDDGLIIGTTVGQVPLWEKELMRWAKKEIDFAQFAEFLPYQSLGHLTQSLCQALGFQGRSLVVSSACSASTQALALASVWVQTGLVKRCLVGGIEVLCDLTVEGFRSLQLLSDNVATPFSKDRKGINLSEGAAFFCVEKSDSRPLAYLSGYGWSTDAFHMASPHPEGVGTLKAIQGALSRAQLSPQEISWIHAHGTGSKANDLAEGIAISKLFGNQSPPVSSTKPIHGHALGASGALEVSLCVKALQNRMILGNAPLHLDPEIPEISYALGNQKSELQHILKNTLGFGGNNAALVLSSANL